MICVTAGEHFRCLIWPSPFRHAVGRWWAETGYRAALAVAVAGPVSGPSEFTVLFVGPWPGRPLGAPLWRPVAWSPRDRGEGPRSAGRGPGSASLVATFWRCAHVVSSIGDLKDHQVCILNLEDFIGWFPLYEFIVISLASLFVIYVCVVFLVRIGQRRGAVPAARRLVGDGFMCGCPLGPRKDQYPVRKVVSYSFVERFVASRFVQSCMLAVFALSGVVALMTLGCGAAA